MAVPVTGTVSLAFVRGSMVHPVRVMAPRESAPRIGFHGKPGDRSVLRLEESKPPEWRRIPIALLRRRPSEAVRGASLSRIQAGLRIRVFALARRLGQARHPVGRTTGVGI